MKRAIFSVVAVAGAATIFAQDYKAVDIGSLTSNGSVFNGPMANNGTTAVRATTATGQIHAAVWNGSSLKDLGTLGGSFSVALGISPNGSFIVGQSALANGKAHAFLYTVSTGVMKDLGTLGGQSSSANSVNDSGVVVGSSNNVLGNRVAAIWQNNTVYPTQNLGGANSEAYFINNDGSITGMSDTPSATMHPFVIVNGEIMDLAPGVPDGGGGFDLPVLNSVNATGCSVRGISSLGAVPTMFVNRMPMVMSTTNPGTVTSVNRFFETCGNFYTINGGFAFRTNGKGEFFAIQGLPGSYGAIAQQMNDLGTVVGTCFTPSGNVAYYDHKGIMVDLNTQTIGLPQGVVLSDAWAVNAQDTVQCTAILNGRNRVFLLKKA
ncbi:MAG: hypothetical protein JSS66_16435 [Armatimonadetes bacterium]|nr:hypothetical protein [Armatimonadota bacterium]